MHSLTFTLMSFLFIGVMSQSPHSCIFKNMKDFPPLMATCQTTLGLKPEDMIKNPLVELPKNGYDDKCFMKCIMTQKKVLKDDGTIDMKAAQDDLNTNAPDGKADALFNLLKSCSDTTAKDPVISKDPCKSIAMIKLCFMQGEAAICT